MRGILLEWAGWAQLGWMGFNGPDGLKMAGWAQMGRMGSMECDSNLSRQHRVRQINFVCYQHVILY